MEKLGEMKMSEMGDRILRQAMKDVAETLRSEANTQELSAISMHVVLERDEDGKLGARGEVRACRMTTTTLKHEPGDKDAIAGEA